MYEETSCEKIASSPCVRYVCEVFATSNREIHSEAYQIKPIFDCNYTFPNDLAENVISFSVKSTNNQR